MVGAAPSSRRMDEPASLAVPGIRNLYVQLYGSAVRHGVLEKNRVARPITQRARTTPENRQAVVDVIRATRVYFLRRMH